MTRSKRLRLLGEIYARIPDARCKGLCVSECGSIPVTPLELERIEEATGRKLAVDREMVAPAILIGKVYEPCPMLVNGRCSAYEVRPAICRLFGVADGLECAHGCFADQLPLSRAETASILIEIEALT